MIHARFAPCHLGRKVDVSCASVRVSSVHDTRALCALPLITIKVDVSCASVCVCVRRALSQCVFGCLHESPGKLQLPKHINTHTHRLQLRSWIGQMKLTFMVHQAQG